MKRINDNEAYTICHKDNHETYLTITPLVDTAEVIIEITSACGETSFTLTPDMLDFITALLTKSKRH